MSGPYVAHPRAELLPAKTQRVGCVARGYARWGGPELFRAMGLFEQGFRLASVAETLGRTPAAVKQKLGKVGLPMRQGMTTPKRLARETGYSDDTVRRVVRLLQLGRRTSRSPRGYRLYLSDEEASQVIAWLREHSLCDWASLPGGEERRAAVAARARRDHGANPLRTRWHAGDVYGGRTLLRSEILGGPARQRFSWLVRCAAGHEKWTTQTEIDAGRARYCRTCHNARGAQKPNHARAPASQRPTEARE